MTKSLTGAEIRTIMRKNKITIERAAKLFNISKKRVREVREHGVEGTIYVWEWSQWLPQRHKERPTD